MLGLFPWHVPDSPELLPLETQQLSACPHFSWRLTPPGRTSHSTPKELAFPPPLAVPFMPPGKRANSAVRVVEGNPLGRPAQREPLCWG